MERCFGHHQTVESPRMGTPGWWTTVWCISTNFWLQILILNEHKIFKISYFHKFNSPLRKIIYPQNTPKNHQKFTKHPKRRNVEWAVKILTAFFYNKKSLTAKEHAAWFSLFSDVHLLPFLEIKQTFNWLIIQLVWHILQQLFTSVSVKVVDVYLTKAR